MDAAEDFEPLTRRWLRRGWALLRGSEEPPSYWLTRFVFLRCLGFVYLAAFATAVFQLPGLIGDAHGLLPVGDFLDRVRGVHGDDAFWELPTVFWWGHSDAALVGVAALGCVLAGAVVLGLTNAGAMLVLWALYMSIDHVGQRWYSFGWETQLLETGLLAVFLCPLLGWRPLDRARPPPRAAIYLLRWLIIRIMLGAGLIKLRGDACWTELTCLEYHFETQPIPNPLSLYLHHAPAWALKGGVLFNHAVELLAPLLAFGPRRPRHVAGAAMILFQVTLIVSGNLSFLNWLTILPCIACFDDQLLRRLVPRRLQSRWGLDAFNPSARAGRAFRYVTYAFAALVAYLSLPVVANLLGQGQAMNRSYDRLHIVNTYGAFGSVGRERHELVIEGTTDPEPTDASEWREYAFKCKPGDPARRPCVITPYHYRLDWLIWFAALDVEYRGKLTREDWVLHLLHKLLTGEPETLALMGPNPFPDAPPTHVRVLFYRYRFAELGSERWWERERLGVLIPPVSREHPGLLRYLQGRGWIKASSTSTSP